MTNGAEPPYGQTYATQSRSRYRLKSWLQRRFATWKSPRALARLLDDLPHGARVLDVGCGEGVLLERLAVERPDVELHGVDTYPADAQGYMRHVGLAEELDIPENHFHLIVCRHVVEHLDDPFPLVRAIRRLLRVEGAVYLECPDARSTRPFMSPSFWDDPTHRRPHTRRSLARLFGICDLEMRRSGRVRNPLVVWLGPLFVPFAILSRDFHFPRAWIGQVFGIWIYAVARKRSAG